MKIQIVMAVYLRTEMGNSFFDLFHFGGIAGSCLQNPQGHFFLFGQHFFLSFNGEDIFQFVIFLSRTFDHCSMCAFVEVVIKIIVVFRIRGFV